MYEKNIDGVIKSDAVQKKHIELPSFVTTYAKYSAYLLGVVLSLLLISLILKTVILAPVADAKTTPTEAVASVMATEPELSDTPAIFPHVSVYYHGEHFGDCEGEDMTVGQALEKLNAVLGENDVPNYSLDEPVFYGMNINIDEVTYREQIVDKAIPYNIIETESHNVPRGTRYVETKGVMGSSQEVVRTKYVNGEPTEETSSFNRYIEPVDEVVLIGVGGTFVAPDGKEYKYSYYLDVTATAYTHTGELTKMGTEARVGVIAVDRKNIALGSKVYVTGSYGDYGVCSAEDIGGGIRGLRIDVFLDTEEECIAFGRRKMRAYVLE